MNFSECIDKFKILMRYFGYTSFNLYDKWVYFRIAHVYKNVC